MHDIVKELGHLSLGTRFKRIGDSLQGQAQSLMAAHGIGLPAAHFPLLAALDRFGPLSVNELSQAVGVSQPVVSRSLRGLEAAGLVQSLSTPSDRRVRRIQLSKTGRELVRRAKRTVWPLIEATVAQACESLAGPLLDQLAGLETGLAQASLQQRAQASQALARRRAPTRKTPS